MAVGPRRGPQVVPGRRVVLEGLGDFRGLWWPVEGLGQAGSAGTATQTRREGRRGRRAARPGPGLAAAGLSL